MQSIPGQNVSIEDEVAKAELTWALNKKWPDSLGLKYPLFLWEVVLGTHWPGVTLSFLYPFLWLSFILKGSVKVLDFFPIWNPYYRVETSPESWTYSFSPRFIWL